MDIIYTTLKQIRSHSPCEDGYKKLVKSLGGIDKYGKDTPLTFKQIYESNGYDDTLWCMRAVNKKWYPLWRHFAFDISDKVIPDETGYTVAQTNAINIKLDKLMVTE